MSGLARRLICISQEPRDAFPVGSHGCVPLPTTRGVMVERTIWLRGPAGRREQAATRLRSPRAGDRAKLEEKVEAVREGTCGVSRTEELVR